MVKSKELKKYGYTTIQRKMSSVLMKTPTPAASKMRDTARSNVRSETLIRNTNTY